MAQYVVIQDIEAEDKLLGPLSLRQFIYAVIVVVLGFVAFQLGRAAWFLALPFAPPMIFFGLLAAPLGREQSSEIWLLAKIRYYMFPRRRIWDQSGLQQLVTITVPKKVEVSYTKGFSRDEVHTRLKALANTLDTRGWAIKNISPGTPMPIALTGQAQDSERLIDITMSPTQAELVVNESADVLNIDTNPVAENLNKRLEEYSEERREELLDKIQSLAAKQTSYAASAAPGENEGANAAQARPAVVSPQPVKPEEPSIPQPIINNAGEIVHRPDEVLSKSATDESSKKSTTTMTSSAETDILISDTGKRKPSSDSLRVNGKQQDDDEVVVSLR